MLYPHENAKIICLFNAFANHARAVINPDFALRAAAAWTALRAQGCSLFLFKFESASHLAGKYRYQDHSVFAQNRANPARHSWMNTSMAGPTMPRKARPAGQRGKDNRGPGRRVVEGARLRLADEVRYIIRRAADHDGRVVTIGQLTLFSSETGDAWLIDRSRSPP
jgi:hypothetical protein